MWYIISGVCGAICIAALIIILITNKKQKTYVEVKDFVGGKENVVSKQIEGTRVYLVLKDYSLVNEEKLKENGVERLIFMQGKLILLSKESKRLFDNL